MSLGGISARFFAIDVNTTHGDADQVGLGEVQFFTPEPATMSLLALGGLGLLRRRRNRA